MNKKQEKVKSMPRDGEAILRGQGGQVIILNTLLFFAIAAAIMFGIVNPVISSYLTTKSFLDSKQTFLLANSSAEEALYRLRNDFEFASYEEVYLTQGTASVSVSDTIDGKQIDIESVSGEFERNIKITAITGVGANFNYGVQVGNGGFYMENNAGVNGNVYANGSIIGDAGTFITGSAIAAATVPETVDQSNDIVGVPSHEIDFAVSGAQDFAQSFTAGTTSDMGKVSFYMKKTGSPSSPTVRIHEDNAGAPGTVLQTASLNSGQVTGSYGWVDVVFSNAISVTNNEEYWITIDASIKSNRYYTLGAHDAYPKGKSKTGSYNSSWSDVDPSGIDAGFRTFVGVNDSIISNVTIGESSADDAWANTVNNSDVTGTIYCQSGSDNNKSCDTSRTDPETQPMPLSQANIDQFIAEAEAGDIFSGNFTASSTTYLGPTKIEGDLIVNDSLVLTGTVYVDGNITVNNNATISLSPSFGGFSGVLMNSGTIYLSNNVIFYGSGINNSYVMLVNTSSCPDGIGCDGNDAIEINNNVGTVIVSAQNGTISFANNAGAKVVTANTIHLKNNVVIDYDSGLANINFSSGPSGGWNISSWQEVE